jgi:hypothetical protein
MKKEPQATQSDRDGIAAAKRLQTQYRILFFTPSYNRDIIQLNRAISRRNIIN